MLKWPLTKLFESPCDKLVITLTLDAYGKYNSRALTRTQVIFPVIITWSCYNYHMINVSIIASEIELIMIVVHSVYIALAIYYSSINAQIVISLGVAHCRALSDS